MNVLKSGDVPNSRATLYNAQKYAYSVGGVLDTQVSTWPSQTQAKKSSYSTMFPSFKYTFQRRDLFSRASITLACRPNTSVIVNLESMALRTTTFAIASVETRKII